MAREPFVVEAEVRERIESALRGAGDWRVVSVRDRPVAEDEQALAAGLSRS
jgi:hypothetical protein